MKGGTVRGGLKKSKYGPPTKGREGDRYTLAQSVEEATGGVEGGEMEVTSIARLQAEGGEVDSVGGGG